MPVPSDDELRAFLNDRAAARSDLESMQGRRVHELRVEAGTEQRVGDAPLQRGEPRSQAPVDKSDEDLRVFLRQQQDPFQLPGGSPLAAGRDAILRDIPIESWNHGMRKMAEYGVPLAAGAVTGGMGPIAATLLQGAAGAGGSILGEAFEPSRDLQQAAMRAGTNAGVSMLGEGIGRGVAGGIKMAAAPLARFAENQGARALGWMTGALDRAGMARARATTREALDKNVLTMLASPEKMLERANKLRESSGKLLESLRAKIDTLHPGADAFQLAHEIEQSLQKEIVPGRSDEAMLRRQAQEVVSDLLSHADQQTGKIPAVQLYKFKKFMSGKITAYRRAVSAPDQIVGDAQQGFEMARGAAQGAEDAQAQAVLPAGDAGQFLGAKKTYGAMKQLAGEKGGVLRHKAHLTQSNNQIMNIPTLASSGIGASMTADPRIGAVVGGIASRFGHQRGNQISAVLANRLAQVAASKSIPPTMRATALVLTKMGERENKLRESSGGIASRFGHQRGNQISAVLANRLAQVAASKSIPPTMRATALALTKMGADELEAFFGDDGD